MNCNLSIPSNQINCSTEVAQVGEGQKQIQRSNQTGPLFTVLPQEILQLILKIIQESEDSGELRKIRGTCFVFNEIIREVLVNSIDRDIDLVNILFKFHISNKYEFANSCFKQKIKNKIKNSIMPILINVSFPEFFNLTSLNKYITYLNNPKNKEGLDNRKAATEQLLASYLEKIIEDSFYNTVFKRLEQHKDDELRFSEVSEKEDEDGNLTMEGIEEMTARIRGSEPEDEHEEGV